MSGVEGLKLGLLSVVERKHRENLWFISPVGAGNDKRELLVTLEDSWCDLRPVVCWPLLTLLLSWRCESRTVRGTERWGPFAVASLTSGVSKERPMIAICKQLW